MMFSMSSDASRHVSSETWTWYESRYVYLLLYIYVIFFLSFDAENNVQ